jgi:Skp family chaperone for outer membrane proteins
MVPGVEYWPYSEPTRIDAVSARLAELRARIALMMGDIVGKADDAKEAAERAEAERKKAQDLFDSLQREIESKRKK